MRLMVITNWSNNYGPKQHDEKLIPIPIYGDGKNIRDWLYVLDHCKGIDIVYHTGKTGQTYNIGGRNERTNLQIVDRILDKTASYKELITFVEDRAGHDRCNKTRKWARIVGLLRQLNGIWVNIM